MPLTATADGFALVVGGTTLLRHSQAAPCLFAGIGTARMEMYRGNFDIEDRLTERAPLRHAQISGTTLCFATAAGQPPRIVAELREGADFAVLAFTAADPQINRVWLRVPAEPGEHVWGGGEQMSYLDLRGRRFPMWTSEPGVGRDKSSPITFQADREGRAGGDYWTTNYPQPTFLSSRRYALHVETTAYSALDFRDPDWHEIEAWAVPARIEFWARPDVPALITAMADRFGRQPPLPEWLYQGAIIGLKDGENSFARLERMQAAGVRVAAVWCEDWAGLRHTSFGARLFWDWRADARRYPQFAARLAWLRARGVRFLGYVNPYLCVDGTLFPEAETAGYLARNAAGGTALVDFGEFDCGVVDFTNPDAAAWFAERVIGQNMLDAGLSGWMADFGEYLPIDVHLANGVDARLMHNAWPVLWAEVNARAIAARGLTGEALFFMRAGFSGVQRHCPLLWGGDQCVDFSRHDGMPSVIPAALSSGLLGNAFHHSDIGGYTSLFGNLRTAELLMRWAEMAAFTPVMRTHEGNRPRDNLQIDGDPLVLAHFARMTQLWVHLVPYLRTLVAEAGATGLPAQRPLFLHFPDDPRCFAVQDAYLYGRDVLVAPVHVTGAIDRETWLPDRADWVHFWSGETHAGGRSVRVAAPLGAPPAFFRADSPHRPLFEAARCILDPSVLALTRRVPP
jgi:alpha-glucosidase